MSSPAGQIRGKKRLAKVNTVRVQLLQNLPGYGRKGRRPMSYFVFVIV